MKKIKILAYLAIFSAFLAFPFLISHAESQADDPATASIISQLNQTLDNLTLQIQNLFRQRNLPLTGAISSFSALSTGNGTNQINSGDSVTLSYLVTGDTRDGSLSYDCGPTGITVLNSQGTVIPCGTNQPVTTGLSSGQVVVRVNNSSGVAQTVTFRAKADSFTTTSSVTVLALPILQSITLNPTSVTQNSSGAPLNIQVTFNGAAGNYSRFEITNITTGSWFPVGLVSPYTLTLSGAFPVGNYTVQARACNSLDACSTAVTAPLIVQASGAAGTTGGTGSGTSTQQLSLNSVTVTPSSFTVGSAFSLQLSGYSSNTAVFVVRSRQISGGSFTSSAANIGFTPNLNVSAATSSIYFPTPGTYVVDAQACDASSVCSSIVNSGTVSVGAQTTTTTTSRAGITTFTYNNIQRDSAGNLPMLRVNSGDTAVISGILNGPFRLATVGCTFDQGNAIVVRNLNDNGTYCGSQGNGPWQNPSSNAYTLQFTNTTNEQKDLVITLKVYDDISGINVTTSQPANSQVINVTVGPASGAGTTATTGTAGTTGATTDTTNRARIIAFDISGSSLVGGVPRLNINSGASATLTGTLSGPFRLATLGCSYNQNNDITVKNLSDNGTYCGILSNGQPGNGPWLNPSASSYTLQFTNNSGASRDLVLYLKVYDDISGTNVNTSQAADFKVINITVWPASGAAGTTGGTGSGTSTQQLSLNSVTVTPSSFTVGSAFSLQLSGYSSNTAVFVVRSRQISGGSFTSSAANIGFTPNLNVSAATSSIYFPTPGTYVVDAQACDASSVCSSIVNSSAVTVTSNPNQNPANSTTATTNHMLIREPLASTVLSEGLMTMMRFRIQADPNEAITLNKILFRVDTQSPSLFSNFALTVYSDSNYATAVAGPLSIANLGQNSLGNAIVARDRLEFPFSPALTIPAGQARYFELKGTAHGIPTDADTSPVNVEVTATYDSPQFIRVSTFPEILASRASAVGGSYTNPGILVSNFAFSTQGPIESGDTVNFRWTTPFAPDPTNTQLVEWSFDCADGIQVEGYACGTRYRMSRDLIVSLRAANINTSNVARGLNINVFYNGVQSRLIFIEVRKQLPGQGLRGTTTALLFPPGSRNLRLYSSGADVRALQTCLSQDSSLFSDDINGLFGASTRTAVIEFQRRANVRRADGTLALTGAVGPLTKAKLNDFCRSDFSRPDIGSSNESGG